MRAARSVLVRALLLLPLTSCGSDDDGTTDKPATDKPATVAPWQATPATTPPIPPGSASVPAWQLEQIGPRRETPHVESPQPPDPRTHLIVVRSKAVVR